MVNDNSTDDTKRIALLAGCQVVDFPYKHDNWVTDFKLAAVKNHGFKELRDDLDYILILGADHVLGPNYIETIVSRMLEHPRIVVAAGVIRGEWTVTPRGSGRIISYKFWKDYGKCYPLNWGYESHVLYYAMAHGFLVKQFNDIVSETQRKTARNYTPKMYYKYGKAMQALGYTGSYTAARCLVIAKRKGIRSGIEMWNGYKSNGVTHYEDEIRYYVTENQKIRLNHVSRLLRFIFHI